LATSWGCRPFWFFKKATVAVRGKYCGSCKPAKMFQHVSTTWSSQWGLSSKGTGPTTITLNRHHSTVYFSNAGRMISSMYGPNRTNTPFIC
jgi:hypothetical protein